MEKKVFYIEKEKFLRSMFEIAFKEKDEGIYTIDTITDNYYLIDDLNPKLVVVDLNSVTEEELATLLTKYSDKKFLVTCTSENKNQIEGKVSNILLKPIAARDLVATILSYI